MISNKEKTVCCAVMSIIMLGVTAPAFATALTLGSMAESITKTFANIGLLVTAGSYIAGLGFSIGAILKFKQHKDSPTQVQVGQPISMVLIAAALLFLPTLLDTVGNTMFGGKANTAGPGGMAITSTSST